MPMVDPEKKEIVELVVQRGVRAPSPCIRLCNGMRTTQKSCASWGRKTVCVHRVFFQFACVRSSARSPFTTSPPVIRSGPSDPVLGSNINFFSTPLFLMCHNFQMS
uniref:Uncharacterized protein n=1 Tax=Arundo donax TaxID=35708 RepID=A0A0A9CNH7_ARUDO